MTDIARLFQAYLAPAIFVPATAMLILSVNVRLMGMVSRLREYVHAKRDAVQNDRLQDAEAYIGRCAISADLRAIVSEWPSDITEARARCDAPSQQSAHLIEARRTVVQWPTRLSACPVPLRRSRGSRKL